MPNVLSPRDLVPRPDIMDETVPHTALESDGNPFQESHVRFLIQLNLTSPKVRTEENYLNKQTA